MQQNKITESQCQSLHDIFIKINKFKYFILLLGIILWVILPLTAIIPLLIYCQINVSTQGKATKINFLQNIIPLILIVFTIVIFMATIKPWSDTSVYVDLYKDVGNKSLFEYVEFLLERQFEPGSLIIPMFVNKITGGDVSWFLFTQSLIINIAFTVYAIIFLSEVYPIVILFNLVSPGYYYQLFYLRHCYSFIFIVPALYFNRFFVRSLFIYLGILCHNSAALFIVTLFTSLINNRYINFFEKIKSSLIRKISIITATILFLISLFFLWQPLLILSQSLFSSSNIFDKLVTYSSDIDFDFELRYEIYDSILTFVILFVFIINADRNCDDKNKNKIFGIWVLVLYEMLFFYITSNFIGFNRRSYYLFTCLPGLFYTIAFYSGKLTGKKSNNIYPVIIVTAISWKIILFINSLINNKGFLDYLKFWNCNPLYKPITEYFVFLYNLFF
jgi:hypothetical protein